MGIKTKDFAEYENMHVAVLKQCDLYDDEDDLMGTQITGVCWDPQQKKRVVRDSS